MGRGRDAGVDVIDGYVRELGHSLRGPRRTRIDLLAEARDGLIDAAEAYELGGCSPAVAQREAVAEFGAVDTVADGYQRVLAFAQARRTVLLVFLVSAWQSIASTYLWRTAGMAWDRDIGPIYRVFAAAVDWLGIGVKVFALVALLLCGFGVRFLGGRRWLPRAVGRYAVAAAVFSLAAGGSLVSGYSLGTLLTAPYLVCWTVVGILPALFVSWSGRRCLVSAS